MSTSTRYRSIAVWPKHPDIYLGNTANESTDDHDTKEQALIVCSLLRRQGFGGDGKVFPLSTRVEPILDEEDTDANYKSLLDREADNEAQRLSYGDV